MAGINVYFNRFEDAESIRWLSLYSKGLWSGQGARALKCRSSNFLYGESSHQTYWSQANHAECWTLSVTSLSFHPYRAQCASHRSQARTRVLPPRGRRKWGNRAASLSIVMLELPGDGTILSSCPNPYSSSSSWVLPPQILQIPNSTVAWQDMYRKEGKKQRDNSAYGNGKRLIPL